MEITSSFPEFRIVVGLSASSSYCNKFLDMVSSHSSNCYSSNNLPISVEGAIQIKKYKILQPAEWSNLLIQMIPSQKFEISHY